MVNVVEISRLLVEVKAPASYLDFDYCLESNAAESTNE